MAIVIQTLSRSKSVIASQLISSKSATVGRGFSCDLHVDDPYVCEQHFDVLINDDNQIQIDDKQSVNGVKVNDKLVQSATVTKDDIIIVGQSRFKVFVADEAIAPTKKLKPLDQYLERIAQKRLLVIFAVFFAAITALQQYVNTFSEIDVGSLVTKVLSLMLVVFIVPLVFGLLSMINKKEARLVTQINIAFIGFIFVFLLNIFSSFVGFNFNQPALLAILETLVRWSALVIGLWLVMYVAFHQSNMKRNSIVFSLLAIVASMQYLPALLDDNDFIALANVDTEIMAPSLLFTSSTDTESFINDSRALFEKAAEFESEE
jgi:hypothetical protein